MSDEQRRQPGCPARELCDELRGRDTSCQASPTLTESQPALNTLDRRVPPRIVGVTPCKVLEGHNRLKLADAGAGLNAGPCGSDWLRRANRRAAGHSTQPNRLDLRVSASSMAAAVDSFEREVRRFARAHGRRPPAVSRTRHGENRWRFRPVAVTWPVNGLHPRESPRNP